MAEVAKGIIEVEINTGSASSELKALLAQINAFQLALNKGNVDQAAFSAKFSKALQQAINQTGSFTAETIRLQTAAATLDKTLTKGKTSLGQFFSAKYNKNSAIAAETMALASERARRLQTQFIATSAAANGFQDALAVRPLAAFSTEAAIAGQKAQIMSSMFKQGTTQLINFGKNVQWAGRQLMVGFTVPLTIFGAVAGKTFMDLEKQVVGFKKVYGDLFTTPAELNENLEAVKGLAAEYTKYGIAVKDTIGLASQAAAAGRQGTELTDSVTQATRLATLGQMDQNAALETTISLQSAFRLSGQDLADTINFLNMVENQTVVSLQDISAAIPRVAPVIQGLGGDVKDLTVFLAAMQEGGVDAAEGANALKSGLASLINPTKQATAMLSGMGINLQSIIEANKGDLMGTVQSFAQALASLDQFSRQQALEQVFGKFQYAKLGALFENISREGSQAQQVIATLGYSTEQLAATADKELKTIEESFGVQLTGAIERFKLAIAPIGEIFVKLAIPLVNLATKIAEAFNGLSDGQKKFAAIGAVIVGIVVPAVTMLTGLFLNLVGTLAKMGQGISLFGMGLIKGGPLGAIKAVTQSAKYLSLAEMDAAMAAQQLIGPTQILNETLVKQAMAGNTAAASIGNLTKAYAAMIATQAGATRDFPGVFGAAGAAGVSAKTSQVVVRGVQKRNSGGPIFMSNGTTVPGSGNTDTVPAMLTPGEFVVNKEATKNNLGLLHNINDSKNPQGLNFGGKAKGIQYLNIGNAVRAFHARQAARAASRSRVNQKPTSADLERLMNEPGGFGEILGTTSQQASRASSATQIESRASVSSGRYLSGQSPAIVSILKSLRSQQKMHGGTRKTRPGGTASRRGVSESNVNARYTDRAGGVSTGDLKLLEEIFGPEDVANLVQRTSKAGSDITAHIFGKGFTKRFPKAFGESGSAPRRTGQALSRLGNYDQETLQKLQGTNSDSIFDVLPENTVVLPGTFNSGLSAGTASGQNFSIRGVDLTTTALHLKKTRLPDGRVISDEAIKEVTERAASILNHDVRNFGSTFDEYSFAKLVAKAEKEAMFEILPRFGFNAGGKVPGYNGGALIGKSLRRRVRPGKEQRLAQQSALHNFAFDSRNVRGTPEMDTILGMMNPLTQKTRATRGTVLGSTRNKELPYAQQKKIVSAIKEGRYEDLFGMKLNFKGGAGSYTTKRDLDFSPFIGDLSNPTLKDFSYGFMGLDTQKKDISKLRKIMKTPKIKKLTPGTAEYARELAMAGWSPARSFRPGPNPTIGSDWTFEQVLANKTRDYNNAKKRLNKTFPDKKIQQLFIDEMVGSGVLALDVQKASYKHPVMSDRNNRVKRLRAKEHELLVGNRTSEITGVASDLRTRLPSLITQSGVQGFNQGNIVPGMGNTDTVPAMLTPGEFVVNKESTKNNYDLLTAINGSQKLNKGGMAGVQYFAEKNKERVVQEQGGAKYFSNKGQGAKISGRSTGVGGMLSGIAPMAAGLGASMLPMAMAPEMGMVGQIAASTAAFSAAQKIVKGSLLKLNGETLKAVDSTGKVGKGFTELFPQLSKLSPNILKFIGPLSGAGAAIALVGFGAYKLNQQINKASSAGADMTKAMYGTVESTEKMAEFFGKQTFATMSRLSSVEKAYGGKISQEAQDASLGFVESDAGKAMVESIASVKSGGGDAIEALRNQLSAGIISGAIGMEEANAIALEVGDAIGDKNIAVKVSAELNQLLGPDGKDMLKNLSTITAEISPTINSNNIASAASYAYDQLAPVQKMFASLFKGGRGSFEETYKLEQISADIAVTFRNEANALELLNAAYQEGTVNIENFVKQRSLITSAGQISLESSAKTLGFASAEELNAASQSKGKGLPSRGGTQTVFTGDEKKAKQLLKEMQDAYRKSLEDSGMLPALVDAAMAKAKDFDLTTLGMLASNQIDEIDIPIVTKMRGDLSPKDFEDFMTNFALLKNVPNIEKTFKFNTSDAPERMQTIVDKSLELQKDPEIVNRFLLKDEFSNVFEAFGINYDSFANLDDISKVMLMQYITTYEVKDAAYKVAARGGGSGENKNLKETTTDDTQMAQLLAQSRKNKEKVEKAITDKSGSGNGADKLKELLKMLMERFRLQEMLIDKEAEGFNKRVKQLNREIELEERQVSLRQKGLEELSKKEDAVNKSYDLRVEALDKVSESNSRIEEQEKSRISLASALASGDIAAAAGIAGEMQQQSAQYQIEDARAALEKQRQVDLDSLTVSINGKLMTRKGIEFEIETIQDRIYNKGIELQGVQDTLIGFEERKLAVAKEREKVETRMYLLEQQKAIQGLRAEAKKKKGKGLTAEEKKELEDYRSSYNQVVDMYNASNPGAKVDKLNYGGSVARMANGGIAYKGSTEPPPALRMGTAGSVPGTGMTDKVNALLTPGEFVIRKSVADKNRGFLESLNSQVFPGMGRKESVPTNNFLDGIGSPRYSIPEQNVGNIPVNNVSSQSSNMYNNTYSVNVNVSGTNASPDDIANVVMAKLSNQNRGNLRSSRY